MAQDPGFDYQGSVDVVMGVRKRQLFKKYGGRRLTGGRYSDLGGSGPTDPGHFKRNKKNLWGGSLANPRTSVVRLGTGYSGL